MAEALKAYATAAQFHAACEMYRAFPDNAAFGQEQRGLNDVPIVYGTGDGSPFAALADRIVAALKDSGFTNVTRATVPDAVHYLVADNPDGGRRADRAARVTRWSAVVGVDHAAHLGDSESAGECRWVHGCLISRQRRAVRSHRSCRR